MTSKEALEKVKDKEFLFIDVESEEWKAILKDLEILAILKQHYRFNQNINEDLLVLKKPISYEDSEKIREWLESDDNG